MYVCVLLNAVLCASKPRWGGLCESPWFLQQDPSLFPPDVLLLLTLAFPDLPQLFPHSWTLKQSQSLGLFHNPARTPVQKLLKEAQKPANFLSAYTLETHV